MAVAELHESSTESVGDILRETEVCKIEKMFDNMSIAWDHNLISKMFDRIYQKYNNISIGLDGVYQMGYIHGIQAERKRRSKGHKNK